MAESLRALLEVDHPILQAGMGGVAGPQLAAAVSNVGCGGVIGLYKLDGSATQQAVGATARLTDRPFGVNMIPEVLDAAMLAAQIDATIEASGPTTFFTFFGMPPAAALSRIASAGRRTLVQVGSVADADRAAAAGVCACIVQGHEAGGHHLGSSPLESLLGQIRRRQPELTLIGAGGICSGGQLRRIEALGAEGCWCGTLFLATAESNAHEHFKRRVVAAKASDTVVTEAFDIGWPGRPHRVLRNRSVDGHGQLDSSFIATTTVAGRRFPIARFSAAVPTAQTQGRVEEMAMYCGTACAAVTAMAPVAQVIDSFLQSR
jgi:nitronate monooxygenase